MTTHQPFPLIVCPSTELSMKTILWDPSISLHVKMLQPKHSHHRKYHHINTFLFPGVLQMSDKHKLALIGALQGWGLVIREGYFAILFILSLKWCHLMRSTHYNAFGIDPYGYASPHPYVCVYVYTLTSFWAVRGYVQPLSKGHPIIRAHHTVPRLDSR